MKRLYSQIRRLGSLMLVLFLAAGLSACDTNIAGTPATDDADLIDRASGPDFTVLTQAIEAAQLTATLRADGPFTVFAPTNEAFAKLPESAIRTLLRPENQTELTELLVAHVVPGRVYVRDVFDLSSAKALNGSDLGFEKRGEAFFVNGAQITTADVEASNGVVHVIDTVLIPEWFDEWFSRTNVGIDPLEDGDF